ncbi:hypothetical protein C7974DRAFT_457167 [Boeremia exigua]|uniref:uncharacterized protein n=1 Tax=Boeremia exigua TaxID=749465 RepID=UPI001E8DC997|nr:uncharacterized protein C7974DRAFT_457167 [Boeremia exigua]KAH6622187.1 hypothetical protein C7974DRAFT_457167 [Boeremia exigua]
MQISLPSSRLRAILNGSTLFVSLALLGISPAMMILSMRGMHRMDSAWPEAYYEWFLGPPTHSGHKHLVQLVYNNTNEHMILAAGIAGVFAGIVSVVGFFLAQKTLKLNAQNHTIRLQIIPGIVSFIVSLIAFIYTQIIFDTENSGKCRFADGYTPNNVFDCTREQAAGSIVVFLTNDPTRLAEIYETQRSVHGDTQTSRALLVPLFVASILMCGFTVGKLLIEKKEYRYVETPDERVERLQRQEE